MDIFRSHSIQLAKKALHVCNVTFAMERFLGDIHPRTGLSIYSARVDSILTYGAQIRCYSRINLTPLGEGPSRFLAPSSTCPQTIHDSRAIF